MMEKLSINLSENSYDIHIGKNILTNCLLPKIKEFTEDQVIVVTNDTIHELYPDHIETLLKKENILTHTCILPDGEKYKNWETLNQIFDFLMHHHANRKTLLIAFGGGVIGDMVGFAAATFMRGISYIQVPTTLLSQVDSSVGGKTAINHPLGKNTIGSFKQPKYVCIDIDFLTTLPKRELYAGFIELVKHGLIHDSNLFEFLSKNDGFLDEFKTEILQTSILRSCKIKANIVEQDEKESGIRATLNYGHTLGHVIETYAGYGDILHGEAVGIGILFATFVSYHLGYLEKEVYITINQFLKPYLFDQKVPQFSKDTFCELILHDKKSNHQTVKFILLSKLGKAFIHPGVTPEQIWGWYQQFLLVNDIELPSSSKRC